MSTLTNPQIKSYLEDAKALIIEPDKWVKGICKTGADYFCTIGAILQSTTGDVYADATREYHQVADHFHDSNKIETSVWVWNDMSERTHAEVMQAFDTAIVAVS